MSRVEVDGVVIEGYRVASGLAKDPRFPEGTIRAQIPHFRDRGLDLSAYYAGTLNVSVAPRHFAIRRATHAFRSVRWTEHFPPEDFSFLPCGVRYGGRVYDGLVYRPHAETKPDHPHDPSIIEIITQRIAELGYGSTVTVALDASAVTLTIPTA